MRKYTNNNREQNKKDTLAVTLSNILGANVVKKEDYDRLYAEKQLILEKSEDINDIKAYLIMTICKLQAFMDYHSKWKPITRKFEKRLSKLKSEKLYVDLDEWPRGVAENLKEAYNCYINGLLMACYIMILRSIELTVNHLYSLEFPVLNDKNGKPNFISASKKLNWAMEAGLIKGADSKVAKAFIEARNESVHEVYTPTELQILSAFETVLILLSNSKGRLKNTTH